MKKQNKFLILLLAVLLLCGNLSQPTTVYAAKNTTKSLNTTNKAARKKFKELLSKSSTATNWDSYSKLENLSFICLDMGKGAKKVPVMIVRNSLASHANGYIALFQYGKGKVRKVCVYDWVEAIYPKAGIIAMCHSGGSYGEIDTYYYKIKGKNSLGKPVAYTAILDDAGYTDKEYDAYMRKMFGDDVYEINGKRVTKAKFEKWWKKQIKGSNKVTNIQKKLKRNTASNRNKYFK